MLSEDALVEIERLTRPKKKIDRVLIVPGILVHNGSS